MKILVLCTFGKNRSRFLAEYLLKKGYVADYAGVENAQAKTQAKIDACDVIVSVHPTVVKKLKSDFDLKGKKVIELDVDDRPQEVLCLIKPLQGDAWLEFQKRYVFSKLVEQIDKFF